MLIQYIDFDGARALDLFSGTGSISLELLSRGCSQVVSVELDRDHHRFIQDCLKKLGDTPQALPIRGDVFRFVKSCKQQFDFIFADPPYALKELLFEHGKEHDFSSDPHFVEHRSYGSVNFTIFRTTEKASL